MQTIKWSKIKATAFIIILLVSGVVCRSEQLEIRYWFNQDSYNVKTVICQSEANSVSIPFYGDNICPLAVLNFQIKDSSGYWSVPYQRIFHPSASKEVELAYIVDSFSPQNLEGNYIDAPELAPGLHTISMYDKNHIITPVTSIFYKKPLYSKDLKLSLTSSRNHLKKDAIVQHSDRQYYFDINNIFPGIYPVNVSIADTANKAIIAMESSIIDVKAAMGNRLTNIYYWLNDSINECHDVEISDAEFPVSKNTDLDIDGFNIPSLDNHLTIEEGNAYIAPNYNVTVMFKSSYGYVVDSTAWITDNSKRTPLLANQLAESTQYDVDNWRPDSCYWYEFKAQMGDEISFSARLRCKVKLYSPSATLLDTITFNNKNKELRTNITETGIHYIQISEIEKSRREFSVLMAYLSGPSTDKKGEDKVEYEGIPIDWEKSSDWKNYDKTISCTKNGIVMTVDGRASQYEPYVAEKSLLCRIYAGNIIGFEADGYIEKITLCLPKIPNYVYPHIVSSNGEISVDSLANTVVWKGFSNQPTIKIDNRTEDCVLPLAKAFVKLSELGKNDISFSDTEHNGTVIDYNPYNIIRIWRGGVQEAWHYLDEDVRITFDENELSIASKGIEHKYSTNERLIITFDFDEKNGIDEIGNNAPSTPVTVNDNNIVISDLPAIVGIYSIAGQTYFEKYVDGPEFNYPISNLPSGIYVITVGNKTTKILIP